MSSVPGAFAENLRRYAPATRRLREAAQRYVDAAVPGAVATVAALPCREPGCPPVEVAVQVLAARHTGCTLLVNGLELDATVDVPLGAALRPVLPVGGGDAAGEGALKSPMPGTLLSVAVEEGQEFGPGDELATVEAMKMQNVLRAEGAGKVKRVVARTGAVLAVDEVILEME